MRSFIKTNDRMINLQNVSNINVLRDRNRIVFNMNYCVDLSNKDYSKSISDYVYWDMNSVSELDINLEILYKNKYFTNNFISKTNDNGYINTNEISSIKFAKHKFRVIFNLSHPISFKNKDQESKITSEFVYVNCNNLKTYSEYITYIEKILSE